MLLDVRSILTYFHSTSSNNVEQANDRATEVNGFRLHYWGCIHLDKLKNIELGINTSDLWFASPILYQLS